ncbi:dTDP-4-dehydrorhamnose reductase [Ferrovibrio sp.]|uniref:dTDP-4-dehydrorhamnose reductase n=1 Tax=Ferrovibrio sp. TaxID=1917215 RepID=UPI0035B1C9AA
MLRIAVIGRQGQLARSLAELADDDVRVTCLGRPDLDLADPPTIAAALWKAPADLVVNAAAYTAVDRAEPEPEHAFAINRDGAEAVAIACAQLGLPLIHVSTDYVFDGRKADPYVEGDACNPQTVYGRSKLAGEQAVLASSGGRAAIVRTAWLHSPFGSNFVRTMLRLANERDRLRVVSDQQGSPTYAPHLARAILMMAQRMAMEPDNAALFRIFHLAGTGHTSWWGLAQEVMTVAASLGHKSVPVDPITTADYPTPAQRPANSVLDCGHVQAVCGIRLPPWQEGVRACLQRLLV